MQVKFRVCIYDWRVCFFFWVHVRSADQFWDYQRSTFIYYYFWFFSSKFGFLFRCFRKVFVFAFDFAQKIVVFFSRWKIVKKATSNPEITPKWFRDGPKMFPSQKIKKSAFSLSLFFTHSLTTPGELFPRGTPRLTPLGPLPLAKKKKQSQLVGSSAS